MAVAAGKDTVRQVGSRKDMILLRTVLKLCTSWQEQFFRVKEESYKAYIEEELSLRKPRKEFHQAHRWVQQAPGEWCEIQQIFRLKGGVFLGPARVLIPECEATAESVGLKGVVWITEGASLVRSAALHLRSLSESEKSLCSITDTEAMSFQDLVRLCHTARCQLNKNMSSKRQKTRNSLTFFKYSVVEAASLQGISPSALMNMRWAVTLKEETLYDGEGSLEAGETERQRRVEGVRGGCMAMRSEGAGEGMEAGIGWRKVMLVVSGLPTILCVDLFVFFLQLPITCVRKALLTVKATAMWVAVETAKKQALPNRFMYTTHTCCRRPILTCHKFAKRATAKEPRQEEIS